MGREGERRGGRSTFNSGKKVVGGREGRGGRGGVDRRSTWKGSIRTLQGLPLTMGGGVNQRSTWKGSART